MGWGLGLELLLQVGAWWKNREWVMVGRGMSEVRLPFGVRALLSPFRVMRWL